MEPRVVMVDTPEEFAAVAHLRGWCHDMDECPICVARRRGKEEGMAAAIQEIACG